MKTLHLVLKHKWFDMIASGIKKEEYREINEYWTKRIWEKRDSISSVTFHRGYTDDTVIFAVNRIVRGIGIEEWGAKWGKVYYVIQLGDAINY